MRDDCSTQVSYVRVEPPPGNELDVSDNIMPRFPNWGSSGGGRDAYDIILDVALVPILIATIVNSKASPCRNRDEMGEKENYDVLSRNLTESLDAFSAPGVPDGRGSEIMVGPKSLAVGEAVSSVATACGLSSSSSTISTAGLPVLPTVPTLPSACTDREGLLPLPPVSQQLIMSTKPMLPGPVPNIAAKPFIPKPMAELASMDQYICRGCGRLFDGISPMSTDRRPYIIRVARHVDRRLSKILRRTGPPSDADRSVILLRFDVFPDYTEFNGYVWTAMREARYCAACVMKEVTLQSRPVNVPLKDSIGFPDEVLNTDADGRRVVLPHLLLPSSAARRLTALLNHQWRENMKRGCCWTYTLVDQGVTPRQITTEDYAKLFE
eukprot:CAMPEP_0176464800 /NCGR_PEP_ID=MMETSP0127-20121128/36779_1 /TAXON_ID=938130 /ORGANISM="Platyophrya macrostoma, Strain WH" /LENGTH=380 /DNA_ID=CAMNT_0017857379 /DNA_START=93 /DNA_END=1235 /DNA_ORIENTATION=-